MFTSVNIGVHETTLNSISHKEMQAGSQLLPRRMFSSEECISIDSLSNEMQTFFTGCVGWGFSKGRLQNSPQWDDKNMLVQTFVTYL